MYNDITAIGNVHIYSYGICVALGILIGYLVLIFRMKKYKQESKRAIDMMLVAIIPGFIGAKINYILVNLGKFTLYEMLWSDHNGYVIYGGVIFGIVGVFLYLKLNKLDIASYMDTGIASVAIAQAIGRIGCLMAGCCYGRSYSGPLAITFHNTNYINDISVYPAQIIFSIADFINFGILCYSKQHNKLKGGTMTLYFITYGLGRFFLEFIRGDSARGVICGMSTAQFTSICMTFIGCIIYAIIKNMVGEQYEKDKKH